MRPSFVVSGSLTASLQLDDVDDLDDFDEDDDAFEDDETGDDDEDEDPDEEEEETWQVRNPLKYANT